MRDNKGIILLLIAILLLSSFGMLATSENQEIIPTRSDPTNDINIKISLNKDEVVVNDYIWLNGTITGQDEELITSKLSVFFEFKETDSRWENIFIAENGVFNCKIYISAREFRAGNYEVYVLFPGSESYSIETSDLVQLLIRGKTYFQYSGQNTEPFVYRGATKKIQYKLVDNQNMGLAGKSVHVKYDLLSLPNSYNKVFNTSRNGSFVITFTAEPEDLLGPVDVELEYKAEGSEILCGNKTVTRIYIRSKTKISIKEIPQKMIRTESYLIKGYILDDQYQDVTKEKLYVYLGSDERYREQFSATTDNNGEFEASILAPLMFPVGENIIEIIFSETEKYDTSRSASNVVIYSKPRIDIKSEISINKGENYTLKFSLTEDNGKIPIRKAIIKVSVDGNHKDDLITDPYGRATYNGVFPDNKERITISATYKGSAVEYYEATDTEITLKPSTDEKDGALLSNIGFWIALTFIIIIILIVIILTMKQKKLHGKKVEKIIQQESISPSSLHQTQPEVAETSMKSIQSQIQPQTPEAQAKKAIKCKNKKPLTRKKNIFIVISIMVIISVILASFYFISTYRSRWSDISKFRDHLLNQRDANNATLYEVSPIPASATELRNVDNPEHCLFIAIGVEKKYTRNEVVTIIDFIWEGGSAIIADDYGYGNSFMEHADDLNEPLNFRFVGKQLWDENYATDPRFIKINVNRDMSRLDFEGVILLNDPTALIPAKSTWRWPGRTLVSSSSKGWIDMNDDGRRSPELKDEHMGYKPIVQETQIGNGKIIFMSDPSIFIDNMWDRENNSKFIDAMVRYLIPNTDENNIKNNKTKEIIILPGLEKSKHKKFEDAEPIDILPGYDSDADGLLDYEEDSNENGIQDKSLGETDRFDPDSDDDGLMDGEEYQWWIKRYIDQTEIGKIPDWVRQVYPNVNENQLYDLYRSTGDLDDDQLANIIDYDSDNDGWSDGYEVIEIGTDPADPDTDRDGVLDSEDSNPLEKN